MHPIIKKSIQCGISLDKGGVGSGKRSTTNLTISDKASAFDFPLPAIYKEKGYTATGQIGKNPKGQHEILHTLYHQGKVVAQGRENVLNTSNTAPQIKATSPEHKKVFLHSYKHYTQ